MAILFDLLLRIARQLTSDVYESIATGGSATTLVDATANIEDDDWWNGGTLFFLSAAAGRINTTATITDFVKTTGTFTFATGTALAATNTYLALTKSWRRAELVRAVNTALGKQDITTSVDSVPMINGQVSYDLTNGVSRVVSVFTKNTESGWKPNYTWKESGNNLRFRNNEPDTGVIMIRYLSKHALVTADSDVISVDMLQDLVVADALADTWLQRWGGVDRNEASKVRYQVYANEAEKLRARYAVRFSADPRYLGI